MLLKSGAMKNFVVPEQDFIVSGHLACPGCAASLAMRLALKALGEKTIIVLPACCWSVIAGPFPTSAVKVPLYHTAFETAAAVASGIRAALDQQGQKGISVMAWAGDGGTFDIGLQALSGAAERNEDFIYVCYDNEAYMNTGIQRSSATPRGTWTTTTPKGHLKSHPKKDIVGIMAAHRIPYIATATVAYPDDFVRKMERAKETKGTRFIHVLAPCPPGWKTSSDESIEMARLAVQTRVFPLFEIEEGESLNFTVESKGLPVGQYLKRQGRFQYMTGEDIEAVQVEVDRRWEMLKSKEIKN